MQWTNFYVCNRDWKATNRILVVKCIFLSAGKVFIASAINSAGHGFHSHSNWRFFTKFSLLFVSIWFEFHNQKMWHNRNVNSLGIMHT